MDKELKKITKQSGIFFLGKIIGLFIVLIFNLLAARFLGADLFGQFTYVYTLISFFPIIAILGLQQGLVYFIPKLNEQKKFVYRNQIITISFVVVSLISVSLTGIIILNSETILSILIQDSSQNYIELLEVTAPIIILLSIIQLSQGVFRGIKNINPFVINQNLIVPSIKILLLLLSFLIIGKQIESLIISFYVSLLVGALFLIYRINNYKLFIKFDKSTLIEYKNVLLFSMPLLFTGFLGFISQKTDIFMIGYYLSDQDIGVYIIALQIGTMSSFILVAFNMIFAPTISSLYHKGEISNLESMLKTITKWIVTVNLVAFSLIYILNEEIMYLFGNEFIMGSTALVLVAIGQLVNAGVGSSGYILIMTGFPKYDMYINIVAVLINVILNIILIPKYGIEGAAIASLIAVSSSNIIRLLLVYKEHRIHPYNLEFLKVITTTLFTTGIVMIFKNNLSYNIVIDLIIYILIFITLFTLLLYKLGLTSEDKELLKNIKRSISSKIARK